ncbi:MAG: aspartyl protease family protein [Chloroflexota bacterium]|nr:aspartyl protease family protein [Chloroflexota bacterium]MDE2961588.1 aspartyl protease family protein [Chloroflexota bacterium]
MIQYGPTIDVRIGYDPNYQPSPGRRAQLPPEVLPALVDTGAQESALDVELADSLNLPVLERRLIAGAGGFFETTVYRAQIYIPELDFTIDGPFDSADLAAGGQPYYALIGRTFLRHFNMAYEGRTGSVIISND